MKGTPHAMHRVRHACALAGCHAHTEMLRAEGASSLVAGFCGAVSTTPFRPRPDSLVRRQPYALKYGAYCGTAERRRRTESRRRIGALDRATGGSGAGLEHDQRVPG